MRPNKPTLYVGANSILPPAEASDPNKTPIENINTVYRAVLYSLKAGASCSTKDTSDITPVTTVNMFMNMDGTLYSIGAIKENLTFHLPASKKLERHHFTCTYGKHAQQ